MQNQALTFYRITSTYGERNTTVVWLSSRSGCKKSFMNANTLSSVICPATITCLKVENSYSLYFSIEVFFFSGAFFLKSNKVVEKEVSEFLINCEVYNKFRRSIQNGFKNSFKIFKRCVQTFKIQRSALQKNTPRPLLP